MRKFGLKKLLKVKIVFSLYLTILSILLTTLSYFQKPTAFFAHLDTILCILVNTFFHPHIWKGNWAHQNSFHPPSLPSHRNPFRSAYFVFSRISICRVRLLFVDSDFNFDFLFNQWACFPPFFKKRVVKITNWL